MGNKNAILPKGAGTGTAQDGEGVCIDGDTGSVSGDGPPGPSPELLASLQSLRENSDYTLLPHSLHQVAEAYSLKGDSDQWAIQFLQLEKLYHERLLSNLAALQENWESQCIENNTECSLPADEDGMGQKHIETLSQICRTHLRPSIGAEQNTLNATHDFENETLQCHNNVNTPTHYTTHHDGDQEQSTTDSDSELPLPQEEEEEEEEEAEEEEETYEEGQEVGEEEREACEGTPEDEEVKVEWPSGVPQASDKDLAKLSHTEGSFCPDGLVSILKRRRASLDGLPPPDDDTATKQISKRKVRFSEPEDGMEQDEAGGDSCLILLLLCLVTVVISIGGTALYCTLVDTYSNICTDFTHNMDFYVINVRRFFEGRWLPLRT